MKVLCHLGDDIAARIESAVPGVDVVAIPMSDNLRDGVEGDVLLTLAW